MRKFVNYFIVLLCTFNMSCKEDPKVIYDEAEVPKYILPAILVDEAGDSIKSYEPWVGHRKKEILDLFSEQVYGRFPNLGYSIEFKEKILSQNYFDSLASVKEIEAFVTTQNGSGKFTILYIYPNGIKNVPVFAGLNFGGNQTIDTLSSISLAEGWVPNNDKRNISENHASAASRGSSASRWPLKIILEHGYGVATVYYGDFDPDYDDHFLNGFHPLFADPEIPRNSSSPGSISIWAKGLSLIADYLVQDSIADPNRLIIIGHSRLGKAALWAGANDERFSAVISNNSGCGGAALSKRAFGETVERINSQFPHWFCDEFKEYNGKEKKLPLDQHMLLALMAPRPLYVASATGDQWADPVGEFLSLKSCTPVYDLFGYTQVFPQNIPDPDKPYRGVTGYHIRSGKHDITDFDWIMYLNWCNRWLVE